MFREALHAAIRKLPGRSEPIANLQMVVIRNNPLHGDRVQKAFLGRTNDVFKWRILLYKIVKIREAFNRWYYRKHPSVIERLDYIRENFRFDYKREVWEKKSPTGTWELWSVLAPHDIDQLPELDLLTAAGFRKQPRESTPHGNSHH